MTTKSIAAKHQSEEKFQTGEVVTVTGGHLVHDTFSSFFSTLLPEILEKLSLSLTQAGFLSAMMQLPSLLNPLIGYLDDRINLRLLVIVAPGVTAVFMSSLGLASSYTSLMILLLITGLSIAAFHAPAPAMIARVSGNQVGKGMSYFMAGGELARTIGPILAAWGVSVMAFEGMYRLAFIGIATSIIMYIRFKDIELRTNPGNHINEIIPKAKKVFPPLLMVLLARSLIITGMSVYLPTLLEGEGASLLVAGGALAIYEFAGVGGVLFSGTMSDKLGRKPIILIASIISSILIIVFVNIQGWLTFPILILLGFVALSVQPVMMALVQDHFPNHRSVANGFYLSMAFIFRSLTAVLIGVMGDRFGLRASFYWIAFLSLIAIPFLYFVPEAPEHNDPSGS